MVTLGWKAGLEQYSPGDLLDQVMAADRAGFDSINVSDHFHPWSEEGQACFTWTWLGAAAALVKHLELGTGEALNEYSAMGDWPDYTVRQDMMRESIDLMRALWTGDEISFCGNSATRYRSAVIITVRATRNSIRCPSGRCLYTSRRWCRKAPISPGSMAMA